MTMEATGLASEGSKRINMFGGLTHKLNQGNPGNRALFLWAWGGNSDNELAILGTPIGNAGVYQRARSRSLPVRQNSFIASDWQSISTAQSAKYALAVKNNGTMWKWGGGFSSPVQIGADTDWSKVFCFGYSTRFAIKTTGTLWAWGSSNSFGQLGLGDTVSRGSSPVQVGTGITGPWSYLSGSGTHTMALRTNGTLWATGWNSIGQLGVNDQTNRSSFTQVGTGVTGPWIHVSASCDNGPTVAKFEARTMAIRQNKTLWGWGEGGGGYNFLGSYVSPGVDRSTPIQIGVLTDWKTVQTGSDHTLALREPGTLWAWGMNTYGQLGLGLSGGMPPRYAYQRGPFRTTPTRVGAKTDWMVIAAGSNMSIGMDRAGRVYNWGSNRGGVLGIGENWQQCPFPVQVGSGSTGPWTKVSCGNQFTAAIRNDGSLWAWGFNREGQLGNGQTAGVLYLNFKRPPPMSPIRIGGLTGWMDISCGDYHTLAIRGTTSGTLWAWGRGGSGQLGNNSTLNRSAPIQIGAFADWVQISAGTRFSAGVRSNGTLWTWGSNLYGTLGLGSSPSTNQSSPSQIGSGTTGPWKSVSCGTNHMAAITTNGTLWSWGYNFDGQLGHGERISKSSPVQVGTGVTGPWSLVSCGRDITTAIRENQTLWNWGDGWLLVGSLSSRSSPVQIGTQSWSSVKSGAIGHSMAIRSDGSLWSWGFATTTESSILGVGDRSYNPSVGLSPVQIGNENNWSYITASSFHGMAIKTDGTLWGWGRRTYGQCGIPLVFSESKPVQVSLPFASGYKVGRELNLGLESALIIR